MVDAETVRFGFVALYGVVLLGGAAALVGTPRELRRYGYPLLGVVALAPVDIVLETFGIGLVPLGAGEVNLANAVRNLLTYLVIYGGVAGLAGISRRTTAAVVTVALVPILATTFAPAVGAGSLAVGVLVAVTVPYPILLYLFLRPVWRAADGVTPRRRLLHWKARNLLLFVYAMILLFVFMVSVGLVVDPVLVELLFRYSVFWFQAGIPAFLVYTFARMDPDEATAIARELAWFRSSTRDDDLAGA